MGEVVSILEAQARKWDSMAEFMEKMAAMHEQLLQSYDERGVRNDIRESVEDMFQFARKEAEECRQEAARFREI